ncbi:MAG: hypothetical protein V3R80_05530 [Candidatus Tectomicrobia bacterium]
MAIIYRPPRYQDLAAAMEVVYQGVNDLVHRHGFEGLAAAITPEFYAFSPKEQLRLPPRTERPDGTPRRPREPSFGAEAQEAN